MYISKVTKKNRYILFFIVFLPARLYFDKCNQLGHQENIICDEVQDDTLTEK